MRTAECIYSGANIARRTSWLLISSLLLLFLRISFWPLFQIDFVHATLPTLRYKFARAINAVVISSLWNACFQHVGDSVILF